MKRWILTIDNKEYKPLFYAETAERAKQYFKDENIKDISIYDSYEYLNDINFLKNNSQCITKSKTRNNFIREFYEASLPDGKLRFQLSFKVEDDLYIDFAVFQFMPRDKKVFPITYQVSNPKEVRNLFFGDSLNCEISSFRSYGQPKLNKPSEIKGIKQSFFVDFISNKCKCQCYIKDNDLWIKHRDFFSQKHRPNLKDIGTPITFRLQKYFGMNKKYLDKFVYPDSWGSIVLRNEAWIVFRNIKQVIERSNSIPLSATMDTFLKSEFLVKHGITELSIDWEIFFEKLCVSYKNCCIVDNKKIVIERMIT